MVGLALMAVFALSAIGVSSASAALPEFLHCTKVAATVTALYETKAACEALKPDKPTKGGWEFLAYLSGEKTTFTSTSGPGSLVAGSNKINCKADTNKGEVVGPAPGKIAKTVVIFTGCKLEAFFEIFECKSKGAKNKEEIETVALMGNLGYINKSAKTAGVELLPETAAEYTNGEIECAGQKVKVTGKVIGEAKPVNEMNTKGTLKFVASGTKQVPEEIEVEGTKLTGVKLQSSLNGGANEEAAETTEDTITFGESIEIMA